MKTNKPYYLGLDIGTDSVGYAVTDECYKLLRFKGQSMWGSGLFDPASPCAERRVFRTARRRLDRRQQRVRLLREFFAKAIAEVDPRFFVRIRESALFAEDRSDPLDNQSLFNDPTFKDADFHHRYPTIHHLILELMNDPSPHDPRLVYVACAWLVAHRGHFLSEVSVENVSSLDDVTALYNDLMDYMNGTAETEDGETTEPSVMWTCDPKAFGDILSRRIGLSGKRDMMKELLWGGNKPKSEDVAYDRIEVVSLLCGCETVKPSKLFRNKAEEYKDLGPLSLGADDEKLETAIAELGDDGELVRKLKALYDWAVLRDVRRGKSCISEAKVAVYDQHRKDLAALKAFLKAHDVKAYRKVFSLCDGKTPNYFAYVYNAKKVGEKALLKRAGKDEFSDWLKKELSSIAPTAEEKPFYDDMMARLDLRLFLPKQTDGDNRVIPHQLYQAELRAILKNAESYLPFLSETDEFGSVADKIESVFVFRVPYFVGPLVSSERSPFAWMKRKCEHGVIRPWNFKEMVDLDASEDEFIRKMTNQCMYVPGEDVLPADSLLYREFELLNELNPLKVAGALITAEAKMRIVDYFRSHRKVSRKALEKFLVQENIMRMGDELAGIDETIKTSLTSYHAFKPWLESGRLTADEVEAIIARSACTEDSGRLLLWIGRQPCAEKLSEGERRKISQFKFSEFGRLSARFLSGIVFESKTTGEKGTVIEFLRRDNIVLMELLSERYTLREKLNEIAVEYYQSHPMTLEKRLDEMYVSSAVKRQIYRALDIVRTVRKVMGAAPKKIFVEMARGGTPDQKGKRTKTRYNQLMDLYKGVHDVEVKQVNAELERMGESADNRLQADALFLWTLQLGHCAYCGKPLPVEGLKSVANIDHIHPQAKVKDDSVLNNKVLCCSECNGKKKDAYPVPDALRQEALWSHWHALHLMNEEKYARLMRRERLTDEELQGFINRQLVETRQTTKAVFTVLGEMMPETELVAVKAGNVSDFRHEFGLVKCRAVNDLHHAKDAYLNIVVGNVYHERFSRQFFRLTDGYTMKIGKLFGEGSRVENAHGVAWEGVTSLARVKETMARNDIHLTKYAFFAKGGFFDQMPKGPGSGTISRKKGLSPEKYGGYAKPSAAGYLLVKYSCGKKKDVMLAPVDLLDVPVLQTGDEAAKHALAKRAVEAVEGKDVSVIGLPDGGKLYKVNTVLTLDGFPYVIRGKSGGGKMYLLSSLRPLVLSNEDEAYIKRLESLSEKFKANSRIVIDEVYDHVSSVRNSELFDVLAAQAASKRFARMPASQAGLISAGRENFCKLDVKGQIGCLLSIVQLLKTNRAGGCDLTSIGGVAKAGVVTLSSKLSNWKKAYSEAQFVNADFSGMFAEASDNLLEYL